MPSFCDIVCKIAEAEFCKRLCLDIKVAKDRNSPDLRETMNLHRPCHHRPAGAGADRRADLSRAERRSVVQTAGTLTADIATTVAHELGHALGLARGQTADPDGVTGHSTQAGNLMAAPPTTTPLELNMKQCREARKSALLVDTTDRCNPAPWE